MDNVDVEDLLCRLSSAIGFAYQIRADKFSKISVREDALIPAIYHYEKMLSIIVFWQKQRDSGERNEFGSIDIDKMRTVAECKRGMCCTELGDFEKAGDSYERAASSARKIRIAEERTEVLYRALFAKGRLLHDQLKFGAAIAVFEETYNMLVDAYYPDHPLVLTAANHLIEELIITKEYYDAER
jgi:tetratricopeptide (TPR) repeat protein